MRGECGWVRVRRRIESGGGGGGGGVGVREEVEVGNEAVGPFVGGEVVKAAVNGVESRWLLG